MPILSPLGTQGPLVAQDIYNCTSQDVRNVLSPTGPGQQILIDYTNRVQMILLRASRWEFLRSDFVFFITARDQTSYWIGPSANTPPGSVDTGLNLSDVNIIQRNTVLDTYRGRYLEFVDEAPYADTLSTSDAQFRPGPPAEWRQDYMFQPNILNIYPAPDNQNQYQPVPATPYLTITPGGSLPERTYYITCTFVDSLGGEGTASEREGQLTIPAGYLVTVNSPSLPYDHTATGVTYSQYNVYASEVTQGETLQTMSPVNVGMNWTEPTSGLTTMGVNAPTTNNLATMDGYIITFRYYMQRQVVTSLTQNLQIPFIYKDIVCAGVNWFACQYLRLKDEAQLWLAIFKDGVREMVKDRNLHPKENDFIFPDPTSIGIGNYTPYVDTFDFNL